jgi:hypothetical protein
MGTNAMSWSSELTARSGSWRVHGPRAEPTRTACQTQADRFPIFDEKRIDVLSHREFLFDEEATCTRSFYTRTRSPQRPQCGRRAFRIPRAKRPGIRE